MPQETHSSTVTQSHQPTWCRYAEGSLHKCKTHIYQESRTITFINCACMLLSKWFYCAWGRQNPKISFSGFQWGFRLSFKRALEDLTLWSLCGQYGEEGGLKQPKYMWACEYAISNIYIYKSCVAKLKLITSYASMSLKDLNKQSIKYRETQFIVIMLHNAAYMGFCCFPHHLGCQHVALPHAT